MMGEVIPLFPEHPVFTPRRGGHHGTYTIRDGLVFVHSDEFGDALPARIGCSSPKAIAMLVLGELADEAAQRQIRI
jgi:hypothetical protein